MKRTFVFVLLLLLCTFLHGCSSKDEMNSTNRELEDMNILSEEDIAWFNTEYFNSGNGINMRNMMLSSHYLNIADIDLYQLFYNVISGTEFQISDEEKAVLTEYNSSAADLDVIKITRQQINEFLLEYTGLNLSDTAQNGLNEFLYLEEYDAYYLIHSDLNYVPCNIMSGMRNKDGNVILEYEMAGKNATVTLKENKSEYYFVSNTVNS